MLPELPLELPWHAHNWSAIRAAHDLDKMPHALMLSGPPGIGLRHFSSLLAQALLCSRPSAADALRPCDDCQTCRLFNVGNHPDYYHPRPDEDGKPPGIDEIRELIDFMHISSRYQRHKIVVVENTDALSRRAIDVLLKTLEEPPPQSLLILQSHRAGLLPATIRSRCQTLRFHPAFDPETQRWVAERAAPATDVARLLKLAGGAPFAVERLLEERVTEHLDALLLDLSALRSGAEDPLRIAEKWRQHGAAWLLSRLLDLIPDVMRLKFSLPLTRYDDVVDRLQTLFKDLELREILDFYNFLLTKRRWSMGAIAVNDRDLLEDVMIYWRRLNGAKIH